MYDVMFFISLLRVQSIGEIKLKNRDEFQYPLINPKYLTHPDDVQTMIDGC